MWIYRKTFIYQNKKENKEFVKEIKFEKIKSRKFVKYYWLWNLFLRMTKDEMRCLFAIMEVIDYEWIFNFVWMLEKIWINYRNKREYMKFYRGLKGLIKLWIVIKLIKWNYKVNEKFIGRWEDKRII